MNIQYNSLTQCTVEFLHWVIQVILKLFCLKLGLYSFTQFPYYNRNDLWLSPFLQVKVSVVSSAGGSFCWNYATDTFYSNYAGANICCNYAGFWGSIVIMLVVLSATLMLVDLFFQLRRWLFLMQFCGLKFLQHLFRWRFLQHICEWQFLLKWCRWESLLQSCRWYFPQCIMHMTISIVIMQVAVSIVAMYVTASSSNFIFLSLTHIHFS